MFSSFFPKKVGYISCFLFFICIHVFSQPHWTKQPPISKYSTLKYITGSSFGSFEEAIRSTLKTVAKAYGNIQITDEMMNKVKITNGKNRTSSFSITTMGTAEGKKIYYRLVESYYDRKTGKYYVLLAVNDREDFPRKFNRSRRVSASFLSLLLPGTGQLIKKETPKGLVMMGSVLAIGAATAYFEITRMNVANKQQEAMTTSLRSFYRDQESRFTLYRNISLGVLAGVYLWSIFDAAISKGKLYAYNNGKKKLKIYPYVQESLLTNNGSIGLKLEFNF